MKEPNDPDIVFLGLILVNFFPLKIFPITRPPISETTETKMEYTITISNWVFVDLALIIKKINTDKYNNEIALYINLNNFSLKLSLIKILEIRA